MARCQVILLADRSVQDIDSIATSLEVALSDVVDFLPNLSKEASLAIAIGGDGTLIKHGRMLAKKSIPLVGVNSGRLGFLARFDVESLVENRREIFVESPPILNAMLLDISVNDELPTIAVNEMMITSGAPFRMLELGLSIDGVPAPTLRGDGVILATPTGSTAHNASAGGPIVDPSTNAFILTPIAAHSLAVRPIVLDGKANITVDILQANQGTSLVIDGQVHCGMKEGMKLKVNQSSHSLSIVLNPTCSYWNTLVDKLHWAAHPELREKME
ncbi:MAG: NAD(+)/NADH kinase [Phycisphaerales bacterium]|nr:NAD(+)/NADH kinase [Planctomycetota bacterium]MBL6997386.1 NAD(+)/NADH kinase [Phycisphaerales bacterium]